MVAAVPYAGMAEMHHAVFQLSSSSEALTPLLNLVGTENLMRLTVEFSPLSSFEMLAPIPNTATLYPRPDVPVVLAVTAMSKSTVFGAEYPDAPVP